MIIADTQKIAEAERFSYWIDTLRASCYPMSGDGPGATAPFAGTLQSWQIGELKVIKFQASRYRVARTRADIAKRQSDSYLLGSVRAGPVLQSQKDDADYSLHPSDLFLLNADTQRQLMAEDSHDWFNDFILIPHRILNFKPLPTTAKSLIFLRRGNGLDALLRSYFEAFIQLRDLDATTAEATSRVLIDLISLAQGSGGELDNPTQSIRSARMQQAAQLITIHHANPRLNPQNLADRLGISLRLLNALFEPSGSGVAAHILAARLEHAKDVLLHHPDLSVLRIGYICGFESQATFYRCFKRAFGVAPGEYRRDQPRD